MSNEALIIALLFTVLLGAFLFYIFRESSKLTGNKPSARQLLSKIAEANKCYEQGRYREALELWPPIIEGFQKIGNVAGVLNMTTMLGHTFEQLGEYEQAAIAYKDSMIVAYRGEYESNLPVAYRRYCICQLLLNRPEEAGNALRALSEIYRHSSEIQKAIDTLNVLAITFRNHGFLDHAAAAYEDALQLANRFEHPAGKAMVLNDKAVFLRRMGHLSAALETAQEAAQIYLPPDLEEEPWLDPTAAEVEAKRLHAHVLSTTSSLLLDLGRMDEARADYLKSLEIATRINSRKFISIAELQGSLIAWETSHRDEAKALLQNARLAAADDEKSKDRRPVNEIFEASYAEQSGNAALALEILAVTAKLYPRLKPNVEATFLNIKARALAKNGQHQEAAAVLAKVAEAAAKLKAPLYLANHSFTAGVVLFYDGNHDEAERRLQQALSFFQSSGFKREPARIQKYRARVLQALSRNEESLAAAAESRRIYLELGDHVSASEV